MKWFLLSATHVVALALGFALGVYLLPILTAPPAPDGAELSAKAEGAAYTGTFSRDLRDSDFLHWGEGQVSVSESLIVHQGQLAPGPDYKLYLVPEFVETEAEFEQIKAASLRVGDVKTFNGFVLEVPQGTDLTAYTTVLIWCEAFGEFITAARYR